MNIPEAVRLTQHLLDHLRERRTYLAGEVLKASTRTIRDLCQAELTLVEAQLTCTEQILANLA